MGKGLQKLMSDLVESARDSARDENGDGIPGFFYFKAGSDGLETVSFQTRTPRDWNHSHNGGDYAEWVRFYPSPIGVGSYEISSYEDADPRNREDYGVLLDLEGVRRLATLAVERVMTELKPSPFNMVKVRRRVEDALRKTAGEADILAIAGLLGVKTE
jgi:hypothetical protein